ncbi:MAG TPA: flagellar assembly protein FliW [Acidimicrobiia bacterium]|nr:flagellar assembly protein FliW [Acidimicrobiia bacterium]
MTTATTQALVNFAAGLPGFPDAHEFLLAHEGGDDSPFWILQSAVDPKVAFVLVVPFAFFPDYDFELDDAGAERIGIADPSDALVFSVVTLAERAEDSTVNLLAPIVVNRHSGEALQHVLSKGYDVKTRILPGS